MRKFKKLLFDFVLITVLTLITSSVSCQNYKIDEGKKLQFSFAVPCEGNCWVVDDLKGNETKIKEGGIQKWNSKETVFRCYFKVDKTGSLNIGILAKSFSGRAKLKVTFGNNSKEVSVSTATFDTVRIGKFNIKSSGYQFVEIQGMERSGEFFPEIESVLIGGEATTGKVYFAHNDFYWGRRGPSVHLNFQVPESAGNVVYFYNEITVPENNDVLG